jgi:hypothetical protein
MSLNHILTSNFFNDIDFTCLQNFFNENNHSDENINFNKYNKIDFKKKIEFKSNKILLNTTCFDIIESLEINFYLDENNILEDVIKYFSIEIGHFILTNIYLQSNCCKIIKRENFYSIIINFNKMFHNFKFLPIARFVYSSVYLNVIGTIKNFDLYINGSILQYTIKNYLKKHFNIYEIIFNEYSLKSEKIINNKLNLNSWPVIINSFYFKFKINIKTHLDSILVKNENNDIITVFTYNDFKFINDNELIIDNFHYKIFVKNTYLEFNFNNKFDNIDFDLILSNYNMLRILDGLAGKVYSR